VAKNNVESDATVDPVRLLRAARTSWPDVDRDRQATTFATHSHADVRKLGNSKWSMAPA